MKLVELIEKLTELKHLDPNHGDLDVKFLIGSDIMNFQSIEKVKSRKIGRELILIFLKDFGQWADFLKDFEPCAEYL